MTDRKILSALLRNARMPIAHVAKAARVSREVAAYRIDRLQRRGIILRFVTRINLAALGFMEASVFCNVRDDARTRFRDYIRQSAHLSWVSEHNGIWNFGLGIVGRTLREIDSHYTDSLRAFGKDIINSRFSMLKRIRFFWERSLGGAVHPLPSIRAVALDKKDKKILSLLSNNARADYTTLARELKMTGQTIKHRLMVLKRAGVIEQYSAFIDLSKLGLYQYSVFFNDTAVLRAAETHDAVVFTVEYVGDPFCEVGIVVKNPFKLREVLGELRQACPEAQVIEHSLVQEDIVSTGPPRCVFE